MVEAGHDLIEEKDPRPSGDGPGHLQALAIGDGQAASPSGGASPTSEQAQHLVGHLEGLPGLRRARSLPNMAPMAAFSRTVIEPKGLTTWKVRPMPRARSGATPGR